jgi:hypothetical protein
MSHAGLAILLIGVGVTIGMTRGSISDARALAISVVLAAVAVSFHVLEILL